MLRPASVSISEPLENRGPPGSAAHPASHRDGRQCNRPAIIRCNTSQVAFHANHNPLADPLQLAHGAALEAVIDGCADRSRKGAQADALDRLPQDAGLERLR